MAWLLFALSLGQLAEGRGDPSVQGAAPAHSAPDEVGCSLHHITIHYITSHYIT